MKIFSLPDGMLLDLVWQQRIYVVCGSFTLLQLPQEADESLRTWSSWFWVCEADAQTDRSATLPHLILSCLFLHKNKWIWEENHRAARLRVWCVFLRFFNINRGSI